LNLDYESTSFRGGSSAAGSATANDEHAILSRVQFSYLERFRNSVAVRGEDFGFGEALAKAHAAAAVTEPETIANNPKRPLLPNGY